MSNWIFYNDEFLLADAPVLQAGNRLMQYGDGLFETMRVHNEKIILAGYHFDRLFSGMQMLMLKMPEYFTLDYLQNNILTLCKKNNLEASARVRLTVFRKPPMPGNSFDQPSVLIETWPLQSQYVFNDASFAIDVYTDIRKCADMASPYKTAAYLPYAAAAVFARQHGLDDCLVTNQSGNVCDSSIANVFMAKNGQLYTPHVVEGCIAGIMRTHIYYSLQRAGVELKAASVTIEMLLSADEVFLTNVIRGIQPVTSFREATYSTGISKNLFETLVKPLTEG